MSDGNGREQRESPRRETARRNAAPLAEVITTARAQFEFLTSRTVDSVSSIRQREGGWAVCLEVVELERIPASTSILGTYEALVDRDGSVIEYERVRRYHRNQASEVDAL